MSTQEIKRNGTKIQLRRVDRVTDDYKENVDVAVGEPIYDITKKTLYIGTGDTAKLVEVAPDRRPRWKSLDEQETMEQ